MPRLDVMQATRYCVQDDKRLLLVSPSCSLPGIADIRYGTEFLERSSIYLLFWGLNRSLACALCHCAESFAMVRAGHLTP